MYDNDEYKSSIKQRCFALPKGQWKRLLEEGIRHRKSLRAVLKQITLKDKAEAFIANFDDILKQPPLPMSTLKRENVMCTASTPFQEKLSDVLYEEPSGSGIGRSFGDQYKAIIDDLKYMENELIQQASLNSKEDVLKARWYLFDIRDNESDGTFCSDNQDDYFPELPDLSKIQKISNSNTDDLYSYKGKNCLLMKLYDSIYNILSHFCNIISNYLDTVGNVYDLLCEYTARWNAYVCTAIELERLLESFTELMNKNYEAIFEGYPSYPKFSIWRLMTKIWLKEVFEKANFKLILNESFLRVLSNHREKNIKQALNNNFININLSEKYSELPKKLFVGLNIRRKKNSSVKYQSYDKLNNTPHVCFADVMDLESRLICSFIQSILDISLNEVNIHYLNCSDVTTNYPYRELEECFLMKTNDFYNDYQHLFHESPDYFYHFLKSDITLLSKLLNERTSLKLETIQLESGAQFMKNFMAEKLQKTPLQEFEKALKNVIPLEENGNDAYLLIEEAIQQVIEGLSREEEKCSNSFYNLPSLDLEEDLDSFDDNKALIKLCVQHKANKKFMNQLVAFFAASSPKFTGNFQYLKDKLDLFANVKAMDTYIKETNTSKNIPYEVGDVDKLFYDLDKDIDLKMLDKLFEDYQQHIKQQELEMKAAAAANNNQQANGMNNFMDQHTNGTDGNFFDFDEEIDLMNLPDLSIRRTQF